MEALNSNLKPINQPNIPPKFIQNTKPTATHVATTKRGRNPCLYCKSTEHAIHQCPDFVNLSVQSRLEKVNLMKLCTNCLRNNHIVENCRISMKCRTCNKRHHSLLHVDSSGQSDLTTTLNNYSTHVNQSIHHDNVLLATAIVLIKNAKNRYESCRIFLEPGSISNCVTRALAKKLRLNCFNENFEIKGLNGTVSNATQSVIVNIKSKYNSYKADNIKCIVVEKITDMLPLMTINRFTLGIPENVQLADPRFYERAEVDMLIGGSLFWSLLCIGQITLPTGIILQKTQLGFIAVGPHNTVYGIPNNPVANRVVCNLAVNTSSLENRVTKFFELESSGTNYDSGAGKCALSLEEIECENHFKSTLRRDVTGRFLVKLPRRDNVINLGESRHLAVKRFLGIERRFCKDEALRSSYSKFIKEYLSLGHMQLVRSVPGNNIAYLPHHAVHKESSSTTKLRVVFDASAKTSNGKSLNDNLMCGPVIQRDLFSIILEFRTFQFALNAYIAKMYRQIRIDEEDANYQLIVWRDSSNEPLQTYKLLTLTYGTKPASFIATRCLSELSSLNSENYPRASHIIKNNLYMDDVLTGANSIPELIQIRDDLINILNQGQFELRKFRSNERSVLPEQPDDTIADVDLSKSEHSKVLGLCWDSLCDTLNYDLNMINHPKRITKRVILSVTSQIFDPLGLIGPIIMKAKIILQQLWMLNLGWDESVPMSIHSSWIAFTSELQNLKIIQIPRKVISNPTIARAEIHGFSDASKQGYGAAVYLRTQNTFGEYEVRLMCAKSRVAPLKTITIPRLELCGSLILARLVNKVRQNISIDISREML